MASSASICDLPAELLRLTYEHLSDVGDMVSLPSDLITKGVPFSIAEGRFLIHHFNINRAGIERLYNLSQYPGISDISPAMFMYSCKFEDMTTDSFFERQWQKHLEVYRIDCLMPRCVTMQDVHKAVGVKSWRECKSCDGPSSQTQQNLEVRSMKKYAALLARAFKSFSEGRISLFILHSRERYYTITRDSQKSLTTLKLARG